MNRKRNESPKKSIHPTTVLAICLAIVTAALGGVWQAWLKNRQIQVAREIDQLERQAGQYQLDIRTAQMRMDQLLNRFAIRQQLSDLGSSMQPIPMGITDEIPLHPEPEKETPIAVVP
jgi:uncharacterized protein HemX